MEVGAYEPKNFDAADTQFHSVDVREILRQKSKISHDEVEDNSSSSEQFYRSVESPRKSLDITSATHRNFIKITLSSTDSPRVSQPSVFDSTIRSIKNEHNMFEEEYQEE